jgi:O-antigen/teichoic acid export membrane protein
MSMGRTWMVQRVSLTQLILGAGLVYPVAMRFGVSGVAVLFSAAYFTGTAYGLISVLRMLDIRLSEWFNSIKAPAVSALIAGGATWLMISTTRLSWLNLGLETLIVLGGYGIIILILDKSVFTDIRSALKKPSDQTSAPSHETSPEFSE